MSEIKSRETHWEKKKGEENVLRGVASTFGGPPDNGGDIITQGAFTKTIANRVNKGKVVLADGHRTDSKSILGKLVSGVETRKDFIIESSFSEAPSVQDTKQKLVEGLIKGLSIGYRSIREEFEQTKDGLVRHIHELKLIEVSVTPFPMNEKAHITSVKSLPFEDLDIAPLDYPWLPGEAQTRVLRLDNLVTQKKAFAGFDRDASSFEVALKCQIADVVEGELKIIPKALHAAALSILRDNKGEEWKDHLAQYYRKMGEVPPWNQTPLDIVLLEAKSGLVDMDRIRAAHTELSRFLVKGESESEESDGPLNAPTNQSSEKARLLKRSQELKLKFSDKRMQAL